MRLAVVLAAGRGTRMRSALPKVLHPVAGRPMLSWVVDAARAAGCERILVVTAPGAEPVRSTLEAAGGDDLVWVLQEHQRGTGHALLQAAGAVEELTGGRSATVLVLSGDTPLVRPETLRRLLAAGAPAGGEVWGALAVAELADPGALGRVLTRSDGSLERIVEVSDASAEELAVRRVNAGVYALPAPRIFEDLERLGSDNAQGEIYLTDAPGAAAARGERVVLFDLPDPEEAFGVNTRAELARAHRRLLDRHLETLMDSGVTVLEPARTVIEPGVRLGPDTMVHPGVTLLGSTAVGAGCELHCGVWLRDTVLEAGVTVLPYSVLEGARVAEGCRVGPFARLRPGAELAGGARVGNFVEVKNARLGPGAKAGHLAYLGDAEVGAGTNIGAGVVTCNYDGESKHRTEIGDRAFVGSDTMLVAPVRVGDDAVTGAGSVITRDVPDGALAVERTRQKTVPGWSRRRQGSRGGGTPERREAESPHPDASASPNPPDPDSV